MGSFEGNREDRDKSGRLREQGGANNGIVTQEGLGGGLWNLYEFIPSWTLSTGRSMIFQRDWEVCFGFPVTDVCYPGGVAARGLWGQGWWGLKLRRVGSKRGTWWPDEFQDTTYHVLLSGFNTNKRVGSDKQHWQGLPEILRLRGDLQKSDTVRCPGGLRRRPRLLQMFGCFE